MEVAREVCHHCVECADKDEDGFYHFWRERLIYCEQVSGNSGQLPWFGQGDEVPNSCVKVFEHAVAAGQTREVDPF